MTWAVVFFFFLQVLTCTVVITRIVLQLIARSFDGRTM